MRGNVRDDLDFVDQAGGNWHFRVSDPVTVTAGGLNGNDEVWAFSEDKDGVSRPVAGLPGDPWAMGAYEP